MAFRLLLVVCLYPSVLGGDMWDQMMNMMKDKGSDGDKSDDSSSGGWNSMSGWGGGNSMSGWGGGNSMSGWGGGNSMSGWGKSMMNMNWMMKMKKMMEEQMEKKKEEDGDWMKEHSKDNIDSYMKWCAEKKERQMMMSSKKQFVKWMMEEQKKREMAMAKAKLEMQSKERAQKIKVQYEQWKLMFSQQQNFESLLHKFKYMKSEYMSTMMCELLKFCKCTDVNSQLKKYFYYTGANSTIIMPGEGDSMFDLDDIKYDLEGSLTTVARRIMGMDEEERMRIFFGAAINGLCEGAKVFAQHVRTWEGKYSIW